MGTQVLCKFCGVPTKYTGTKQCDNCWEVSTRLRGMPLIVRDSILKYLEDEETKTKKKKRMIEIDTMLFNGYRPQ